MATTRFAPSPTGYLHIGHFYAAWFAWQKAGRQGRFLVRMEDIDSSRCRPEFESAILEDLVWAGLEWAGEVVRQSEHCVRYREALQRLVDLGVCYPCFCTRAEVAAEIAALGGAPQGPEGPLYPGTCRSLSSCDAAERVRKGAPYALRLNAEVAGRLCGPLTFFDRGRGRMDVNPAILGDVVISRRDAAVSYHLCATVDDAWQGVTLVTRGDDLLASTHVHRLLQHLLGLEEPEYHHHPLLLDSNGRRFAKRNRGVTLRDLRDRGLGPGDVMSLVRQNLESRGLDTHL